MDEKDKFIKALQEKNVQLEEQNAYLREEVNLLKLKLYGQSSEKTKPDKDLKFNEAEESASVEPESAHSETSKTKAKEKSEGRKTSINSAIPREDKKFELVGDQLECCTGKGKFLKIGEKIRERLDIVPATLVVNRYIEMTYKCNCCGKIVTKKAPKQIIQKGDVDTGLLATLIVGKYEDHIPLYRHEEIFCRLGVDIARNTTARWVIQAADAFRPLINIMKDDMQKSDYVQCDETTVQVLQEKNRKAESKSFMWVVRNMNEMRPMVLFNYEQSRSGKTAMNILEGIKGAIQTDGYAGYNGLEKEDVVHLACWAHARRKFDEAVKAALKANKKKKQSPDKKTLGEIGRQIINILYRIDRLATKLPIDRVVRMSRILVKFKLWLDETKKMVPPKALTGKAVNYTLGIWDKLCVTAMNSKYHLDNNLCENAIRPFALGRRNWLFSCTENGAEASAIIYSLIQSAKMNGHNPYDYIHHLIEEIPKANALEHFEKLLPYNWKPPS